jgi:hypothetical protein
MFKTDVLLMLLQPHVHGTACLPNVDLAALSGCFRLVTQSAATCSRWFFARGFFYPEDGDNTFSSEMSVHPRSTQRHIPEDSILHFSDHFIFGVV